MPNKKKITTTTTTTVTTEVLDESPLRTLINVVIDMSGSMQNVWHQTIAGFNEYVNGHRSLPNCDISLTLFDTVVETPYTAIPVSQAPELTDSVYRPRGGTALRDAIGRSINAVASIAHKYDKVLFVIMTDGAENASREYSTSTLSAMIREKESKGFDFVYLGANSDAWLDSQNLGFTGINNYNYISTPTGTNNLFRNLTSSSVVYASSIRATANNSFTNLSNLTATTAEVPPTPDLNK